MQQLGPGLLKINDEIIAIISNFSVLFLFIFYAIIAFYCSMLFPSPNLECSNIEGKIGNKKGISISFFLSKIKYGGNGMSIKGGMESHSSSFQFYDRFNSRINKFPFKCFFFHLEFFF